jgi:carbon storage regulator
MLVLTRKVDESIVIGDSIVVKVLSSDGNSIKLGIDAPRSVPVHRKEVYDEIVRENRAALEAPAPDLSSLMELVKKRDA